MSKLQFLLLFICSFFWCKCFTQENTDTSMNVFFETNDFKLNKDQLTTIRHFLTAYPVITCITGYADSTGTSGYNLALSRKRAFAIYNTISISDGSVSSTIVRYHGESEELPELWMNRRVQICAHKPSSQILEKNSTAKLNDEPLAGNDSLNNKDTIRVINLENLYFYPDMSVLTQESIPYLKELAQQLKAYPGSTFEIIGHVNYQSRFDSTHLRDLYLLSRQRAKAVYDYLVQFGIPAAKMKYKGVGNSQPLIVHPKNDEERRKNMRVQVIITNK